MVRTSASAGGGTCGDKGLHARVRPIRGDTKLKGDGAMKKTITQPTPKTQQLKLLVVRTGVRAGVRTLKRA